MRQFILSVAAVAGAITLLSACDSNINQALDNPQAMTQEDRVVRMSPEELGARHYDALVQLLADVQHVENGSGKTPVDGRNVAKESCKRFLERQPSPLFRQADCGSAMDAFHEFSRRQAKNTVGYGEGVLDALATSGAYSDGQLRVIGDVFQVLESVSWEEDEYASQTVGGELDRILDDSQQSLNEEEVLAVRDVVAVARGSASFWSEYTDDLILAYADMYGVTLEIESGKQDVVLACNIGAIFGFSCAEVAMSDVAGAAGGAAVGLIFGPSALVGAGGGAVAGSVENGVSQILSYFYN